ncbi:hypothetical protein BX600DRAFT_555942 [Xylariales sp. PMI_506]|nr:hypothetical protein BX600DRAFT_555942 [Xylariales sp. PMI_506]
MASHSTSSEIACGIHELYKPSNGVPEVDIVAVHGLNGNVRQTWTSKNTGRCWLDDPEFLPKYLPNARVLSWGYNASFSSLTGATPSQEMIHHHAQTLVANLSAQRQLTGTHDKPIIFLCHSLGGIVVKRALLYVKAREGSAHSQYYQILNCTYGILFFGTPHHGSSKAQWLGYLKRIASMAVPWPLSVSQSPLVSALERDSETLQNITLDFVPIMKRFRIFFFWEQEKTSLKSIINEYIVSSDSAAPVHDETERSGIAADHSGMVKFDNPTSQGFRTVIEALVRYSRQAPGAVDANLAYAAAAIEQEKRRRAIEILGYYPVHPSTSTPSNEVQGIASSRQDLNIHGTFLIENGQNRRF